MPLSLGTLVAGQYRIMQRVRSDGHCIIYAATDIQLMRPVIVSETHADPDAATDRALALRTLRDYPHIVPILDNFTENGKTYIITEPVLSVSLDHYAAKRSLPPEQVCYLLSTLTDALLVIHSLDIRHGSLSPRHILLDPDGNVRVTGFFAANILQKGTPDDDIASLGDALASVCQSDTLPAALSALLSRMRNRGVRHHITTVFELMHALNSIGIERIAPEVTITAPAIDHEMQPRWKWLFIGIGAAAVCIAVTLYFLLRA